MMKQYLKSTSMSGWILKQIAIGSCIGLVLIGGLVLAGEWLQTDSTNRFYKISWNEYDAGGPSTVWNAYSDSVDNLFNKVWRDAPINVVSDYGADPTGVADSTTAIQNAIDAAEGMAYPVKIKVPVGVYKITSALTINKPLIFEGEGYGRGLSNVTGHYLTKIINAGTSNNAIEISPSGENVLSGVILRDFLIEGAGSGATSGHGILIDSVGASPKGVEHIVLENVTTYNHKEHGFYIKGNSFLIEVHNLMAIENSGDGIRIDAPSGGYLSPSSG